MNKKSLYMKIFVDFTFLITTVLFIVYLLPKIAYFFLPFLIGWFISLMANPIVKFMESKIKIIRKFGSVITIFLAIVLVMLLMYVGLYALFGQIVNIINDMPEMMNKVDMQIEELTGKYIKIYNMLPEFVQNYIDILRINFREQGDNIGAKNSAFDMAEVAFKNVVSFLIFLLFTILSAYFFTAEKIKIENKIKNALPECMLVPLKLIFDNFKSAIGGYFKAQFKLMLIMILIIYVGLKVLGINYAFMISAIIGVIDFLPVLGSGIILVPWGIYKLLLRDYYVGSGIIFLYILCQIVRQMLQPKMVGKSVGVSSFATLFMLYIGYKIGGLLGIIVSIPAGIVLVNLYKAGLFDVFKDDVRYMLSNISVFRRENADEISEILKRRKYIDRGEK